MKRLYIDYESFLFYPGLQAPPPVCLTYALDEGPAQILHCNFDAQKVYDLMLSALLNDEVEIVAHYASAEFLFTLARWTWLAPLLFAKVDKGLWRCTYVREKLIRVGRGDKSELFDLKSTMEAHRLPNAHIDKKDPCRLRFGTLWDVPVTEWPEEFVRYAVGDIAVRDIFKAQDKLGAKYFVNEKEQMQAQIFLALTTAWGFPSDMDLAHKLWAETIEDIEASKQLLIEHKILVQEKKKGEMVWVKKKAPACEVLTSAFAAMGRDPPRGDVTPTMFAKGYTKAGLTPPPLGRDGKVSEEMLEDAFQDGVTLEGNLSLNEEACLASGSPLLLAYTKYGQGNTLISKAKRLTKPLIQSFFDVLKATGRTSCKEPPGTDADPLKAPSSHASQLQNMARSGEEAEDENGKKYTKLGQRECHVAHGFYEWMKEQERCYAE